MSFKDNLYENGNNFLTKVNQVAMNVCVLMHMHVCEEEGIRGGRDPPNP